MKLFFCHIECVNILTIFWQPIFGGRHLKDIRSPQNTRIQNTIYHSPSQRERSSSIPRFFKYIFVELMFYWFCCQLIYCFCCYCCFLIFDFFYFLVCLFTNYYLFKETTIFSLSLSRYNTIDKL